MKVMRTHENALLLREASIKGNLKKWTEELTSIVISSCNAVGWEAAGKGHRLEVLPESRNEYLTLDVMAFEMASGKVNKGKTWPFPVAVFELENSKKDARIAYSLWKVLCIQADLKVVFCYRKAAEEGPALVRYLRDEVIGSMEIEQRTELKGETLIAVGSRSDSETFPYGFFRWWKLNNNTGRLELI